MGESSRASSDKKRDRSVAHNVQEIIELFKTTLADWQEDKASRLAAALAYYAAISLAPLVIILVAIAGFAFGPEAARGEIVAELRGLIGSQSARAIEEIIEGREQAGIGYGRNSCRSCHPAGRGVRSLRGSSGWAQHDMGGYTKAGPRCGGSH